MYTIQHTIFSRYVDTHNTETEQEARKKAEILNNDGWLNIRIITPDNTIIQAYGE